MAETYEAARGKFASKIATKPAKKKAAKRKPVTRYREAFAGAAKRNSGGKY
jgi:hypothetical protein